MENILSDSIIVRSKLEKDDFVKANKVILKMKKNERKWLVYIISFFVSAIAIGIGIFKGMNESTNVQHYVPKNDLPPAPWYIAFLPTISLVVIVVGLFAFIEYAKNHLPKRHYDSNKLIQDETQFTFDDSGIEYKTERSLSKIK